MFHPVHFLSVTRVCFARSRTRVCKQVYTCMFHVFRREQKAMGMAKRIGAKGRDLLGVCD